MTAERLIGAVFLLGFLATAACGERDLAPADDAPAPAITTGTTGAPGPGTVGTPGTPAAPDPDTISADRQVPDEQVAPGGGARD
jgi:hypothetical protein